MYYCNSSLVLRDGEEKRIIKGKELFLEVRLANERSGEPALLTASAFLIRTKALFWSLAVCVEVAGKEKFSREAWHAKLNLIILSRPRSWPRQKFPQPSAIVALLMHRDRSCRFLNVSRFFRETSSCIMNRGTRVFSISCADSLKNCFFFFCEEKSLSELAHLFSRVNKW